MIGELLEKARMKGSDRAFRQWIQRQPSCYSGQFSEWVNGEGRCVAAHVRRAGESGTGHKGEYACVPLTDEEHRAQHAYGESALMPKDWWDEQRVKYLKRWLET